MVSGHILRHYLTNEGKGKGKAVPTGLERPLVLQEVEAFRICTQSAHEGAKVVSSTHLPPLPPRKYSWYSFLLEDESIPQPQYSRKDYVNEKSH